ncbi:hypothetical protein [Nocardia sp. NPDC003963]
MALNNDYFDFTVDDEGFEDLRRIALAAFGIPVTDIAHEEAMALVMAMMCVRENHVTAALNYVSQPDAGVMNALDSARDHRVLRPLRITIEPTWWQRATFQRRQVLSWS